MKYKNVSLIAEENKVECKAVSHSVVFFFFTESHDCYNIRVTIVIIVRVAIKLRFILFFN